MRRAPAMTLCSAALALLCAGCIAPPGVPEGFVRITPSEGAPLAAPASPVTMRALWLPDSGRLDDSVRKRHEPPGDGEGTFLNATFDSAHSPPPGWSGFGAVVFNPFRMAGVDGQSIAASSGASAESPAGLECPLDASLLGGRDARLELTFACPSAAHVAALAGVRIVLVVIRAGGEPGFVSLPIEADLSPGWESRSWHVRFAPGLRSARLRILLTSPPSGLILSSLEIACTDPMSIATASAPATRPAPGPINLVRDGGFESGQARFFASRTGRWPNGEDLVLPLRWEFDTACVAGEACLLLQAGGATSRIGFGPLDLTSGAASAERASTWYLNFYARSAAPRSVTVSLKTRGVVLGRASFQLPDAWKRYSHVFSVAARDDYEQMEARHAELVFDFSDSDSTDARCWLDAVTLTDVPLSEAAPQPAGIELGLIGPLPGRFDLDNLVDEGDALTVSVRLVSEGNPTPPTTTAPVGQLAIDVVDAWDQVVWTRTTEPSFDAGRFNETIPLRLPRGYYRVLATLWRGQPGESELVRGSSLALGVIAARDPVPLANPFGLSAESGYVSERTTHLGAGWVRIELPARRLQAGTGWDFGLWRDLMVACDEAHVQAVVGVTLPSEAAAARDFLGKWLSTRAAAGLAVVVRPSDATGASVPGYARHLRLTREMVAGSSADVLVVGDLAGLNGVATTSPVENADSVPVGFSCGDTALPEGVEPLLQEVGRAWRGRRLWDLSVPVHIGGAPDPSRHIEPLEPRAAREPVQLLNPGPDPLLAASRMVRSLLVRSLAGAELACCDAVALAPVRSLYDPVDRCLHERDHSPRVALVAFDILTSLLNDARLVRWLDLPGGSRVLYYEKEDGGAVAAIWRPFGMSATRVSLGNLPPSIRLLDCTGRVEPVTDHLMVNEVARFLVAPADASAALAKSLENIHVLP